jgi:hypothetical protein
MKHAYVILCSLGISACSQENFVGGVVIGNQQALTVIEQVGGRTVTVAPNSQGEPCLHR